MLYFYLSGNLNYMAMEKDKIYMNDWLDIHPYMVQKDADSYFVNLSNVILNELDLKEVPLGIKKKCAIYTAAYLEDIVSGLGLWKAFIEKNRELYDTTLPFYRVSDTYVDNEVNEDDVRFIIWNTLYKSDYTAIPVNPLNEDIKKSASNICRILDAEYEIAPANEYITDFFRDFKDKEEADKKLEWLFGRTYITQPSVQSFIKDVTYDDRFIIPCGPLALFLHEWIDLLTDGANKKWHRIAGLFFSAPEPTEQMKERNIATYNNFMTGNNGECIVYLKGYDKLRKFLVNVLLWPDDENHTLPQMKQFNNFVMMCNPEKGVLLAHDICEYIKDPLNSMYNEEEATKGAFTLLTIPTKCPPDLLEYVIENNYIPDAKWPVYGEKALVQHNADFIARCTLLYYYRGD